MKNFEDHSHFTDKVGDYILNRMFGNRSEEIPADFGVLVTPENVDKHLEQVKSQCQLWKKQNPETVQWLETLNLNGHLITSGLSIQGKGNESNRNYLLFNGRAKTFWRIEP